MLTIATPFGGHEAPFFDRWLAALRGLRISNRRTHLLWLDNSDCPEFTSRLEVAAERLRQHFASVTILTDPTRYSPDRLPHVSALWRTLRDHMATPYILCLESDVIPDAGVVDRLLSYMISHLEIGAIAPPVPWPNSDGSVHCLAWHLTENRLFPEGDDCKDMVLSAMFIDTVRTEEPEPVDAVSFSCLLTRLDILKQASLDESSPNLAFDQQFSYQVQAAGLEVWLDWGSRVVHVKEVGGELTDLVVPGMSSGGVATMTGHVYKTAIGPVQVVSDWQELHHIFAARCFWQDVERTSAVQVLVRKGSQEDIDGFMHEGDPSPEAEARTFRVMGGVFRVSRSIIEGVVPARSYTAGTVLDWLWLAVPTFCAPDGWEAIHAAAVVKADEALLILGRSGAGKTTAFVEFLRRGALLLSDDLVLLNPATGMVRGWDQSLHLTLDAAIALNVQASGTLDFAGKLRAGPGAYRVAPGGEYAVTQVIALSELDEAHHTGWGFDTAWVPRRHGLRFLRQRADYWGPRPVCLSALVTSALARSSYPIGVICTPFEGKAALLNRWMIALRRSGAPANARFLWLCNTADAAFRSRLETYAEEFGAEILDCVIKLDGKDETVAKLWSVIAENIPDECEYVLTLEHDVLVYPDGIRAFLDQWLRSDPCVMGVPILQWYGHGRTARMAWMIHQDEAGYYFTDAVPADAPSEVDAVSLSLTLWPAASFRALSFRPGTSLDLTRMGYDLAACREVDLPVYAAWNLRARHEGRDELSVIEAPLRLAVVGPGSHDVAKGITWTVVAHDGVGTLTALARKHAPIADALLYVESGVTPSQTFLSEAVQVLRAQRNTALVRGESVAPDGKVYPLGAALIRSEAATMARGGSIPLMRQALVAEGWSEVVVRDAVCLGLPGRLDLSTPEDAVIDPFLPRVLLQNRHPWVGAQAGYGGDMTHAISILQPLRKMGCKVDFRGVEFADYKGRWDVINLFNAQQPWVQDFATRDLGDMKLVVTAITHGTPGLREWAGVVGRADLLLVYSEKEGKFYSQQMPGLAEKIRRFPIGVQDEIYEVGTLIAPSETPSVLMVARYCDYKNQLGALRACRQLDVPIVFAGPSIAPEFEGGYRQALIDEAEGWGKATFYDTLRGNDLWRLYQYAWVSMLPSRFEPLGLANLDALAFRCGIVSTQHSWASEEWRRWGTLCDPDDQASVTRALRVELDKPRGWAGFRPPSATEAASETLALYRELL